MPKHWVPLESNPDVLNAYASKLGAIGIPNLYNFVDVFGLDAELLAFVPQPVLGVLLLFPLQREKETNSGSYQGKEEAGESWPKNQLFYMKQTIGNACGTIGLLHIICNTAKPSGTDTEQGDKENANKDWNEVVPLAQEGFLNTFTRETKNMSPEERGSYLENPPNEAVSIDSIHEEAAQQGNTAAPEPEADIDLHFVAFVAKSGRIWELDGRKCGPIDHGSTCEESFLNDVAAVIRSNFVEKAEGNLNFSLIALTRSQ